MALVNTNHVKASQVDQYFIDHEFQTRIDAGAVTSNGPSYGADCAWARTGNGVYTLTFATTKKPLKARCFVNVAENSNVTGCAVYDPSTGVVTVRLWAQAGGADNTADLTVELLMLCSKSSRTK